MNRTRVVSFATIAVCLGGLLLVNAAQNAPANAPQLGITYVKLGSKHRIHGGRLMAFVMSGSADKRIIVSINEHWVPGDRVDDVASSARELKPFGHGVLLMLHTDSGRPFPVDTHVHVTIQQPGADFADPTPIAVTFENDVVRVKE